MSAIPGASGQAEKARITLADAPLAANSPIAWRFSTGVSPSQAVFFTHKSIWDSKLKSQIGEPLTLKIKDARGVETVIREVYILHVLPSDGPYRVAFVVADRRWKWAYKLIVRDYNIPKRTGDIVLPGNQGEQPVETQVDVDVYAYRGYSLGPDGRRWTAKQAVEDVLKQLEPDGGYAIESFPIEGDSEAGQFTLQNVEIRDQGDAALSRLLSYVPGAEIRVDADGKARVFDSADIEITRQHLKKLPPTTWDGDYPAWVERKAIRPKRVLIYYQREVETLFEFEDAYETTSSQPGRNTPFLENVIPTVDPTTRITEYDPETGTNVEKVVRAGTWVRVDTWLDAMNDDRPDGSMPWTFANIRLHWLHGDLEGILGGRIDSSEYANIGLRIQALKTHFRQTFRMSRRYVERVRNILPIRAGLLDPVTGARAPSPVWGQICIIPTDKGKRITARTGTFENIYRNVDYLSGLTTIDKPPGPARVDVIDADLGIFRVNWIESPYGTVQTILPCHLVDNAEQQSSPIRNLAEQDNYPMGPGFKMENAVALIQLRRTMELASILTIVPAAPNNSRQFHRVEVKAEDVSDVFRGEFRIENGEGPDLHVFIPPGELTARFGWNDDQQARSTIADLLGLTTDDPQLAGIEGPDLPGFLLVNGESEIKAHSRAVAAEMLAYFADNVQGRITTRVPEDGLKLVGNMSGAAIVVSAAPSAKVVAVHEFPGQQKPISRMALLPESARHMILGTLPLGQ